MWRDPHLAKEKKATKRAVWVKVGGKREVDKIWKRRGGSKQYMSGLDKILLKPLQGTN